MRAAADRLANVEEPLRAWLTHSTTVEARLVDGARAARASIVPPVQVQT